MKLIPDTPRKISSLDDSMIPAINIVFLLLIFFMVAGQIKAPQEELAIPSSISESELASLDAVLEIDAQGKLTLNHQPINSIRELGASNESGKISSLTLRVHKTLSVDVLDPILRRIRELGLKQVQLETKQS